MEAIKGIAQELEISKGYPHNKSKWVSKTGTANIRH